MTDIKKKLLTILGKRPIIIWGARMTGIGFFRFSQRHNRKVLGFVDSDPSFQGKKIYDLQVLKPSQLAALKKAQPKLIVVIAVSIKEDEIISRLKKLKLSSKDYLLYKDYSDTFFTIDVAGTCNLKCPSCANSTCLASRPKGFMSLEDFKKITQKILKEVGLISHFCLYNWGEPLLHPKLNLFIDYAHQMGIATAVSTNFSIPNAQQIKKIVKASPDIFKISVSGYYPQVYNTTHTGGDINLVKSNMYRLRYLMDKYHSSFVVEVNYHLYKNNIGKDLNKMKALCQELGFVLSTCHANVTPVERLIAVTQGKTDQRTESLRQLLLVDVKKGLEITKPFHHLPCRFLSNQLNINWDRSVALCCVCYDPDTTTIAADFLKQSLKDIRKAQKNHPLCRQCQKLGIPQYLMEVNSARWQKEAQKATRKK